MRCPYLHIVLYLVLMLSPFASKAQKVLGTNPAIRTRILFLLDASGSMGGTWNNKTTESKIESAKKILTELADSLTKYDNVEIGLRVYGHQYPAAERNCTDTKLEAGLSRVNYEFIKTKIRSIRPKGITPIAYAMEKAAGDFPDAPGRNIIIIMTDGQESCTGDPCAIAALLEKKNIVLKHFVIGFALEPNSEKFFECIGTNYNVNNQQTFQNVMVNIMSRILNKTTAQVNLLDQQKLPTETDVNMSFYSADHHIIKYNYYHKLNSKGLPDTIALDPVTDYDLVVHTIPPIKKENIRIDPDRHNTISIDAAQGFLDVQMLGKTIDNNLNNRIKCLVRTGKGGNLVHVQDLNTKEKYLAGNYDLEILTLPRTYLNDVQLSQQKPYLVQLPTPGIANFVKKYEVYGGIFIMKNQHLEKIYELNPDNSMSKVETIALQPGYYQIIYRLKSSKSMHSSQSIAFEIKSGESISLTLDVQ
ncbi:MAG: VWA domain-containing protein [Chitinophagales bacterium]|nr:VWA domain-containing protein [Chitinophagales bacterium]